MDTIEVLTKTWNELHAIGIFVQQNFVEILILLVVVSVFAVIARFVLHISLKLLSLVLPLIVFVVIGYFILQWL